MRGMNQESRSELAYLGIASIFSRFPLAKPNPPLLICSTLAVRCTRDPSVRPVHTEGAVARCDRPFVRVGFRVRGGGLST
ncbi:hypothetical protein GCM10009768_17310 [Leucobacter iarius]|uniref:Uncharacterized protein n=1 Tax=Leucobacter iarius TaxID=333963 RepID=A0ABN2LHT0_9MICO